MLKVLRCPSCKIELLPDVTGLRTCPACNKEVRIDVFSAALRPIEQGQRAEPLVMEAESSCFYHPAKRAVVPCDRCGRFLCTVCDLEVDGRHVCPTCLDRASSEGAGARLETRRVLYESIALDLAIAPVVLFCMWFLSFLTAPMTLYVGIRYWRAPGSVMSQGKWRMAIAVGLAGLQIIGWCVFLTGIFTGALE